MLVHENMVCPEISFLSPPQLVWPSSQTRSGEPTPKQSVSGSAFTKRCSHRCLGHALELLHALAFSRLCPRSAGIARTSRVCTSKVHRQEE